MKLRLLAADEVRQALPMAEAIAGMKQAFAQLSAGEAIVPLRSHMSIAESGTTLIMPAFLPQTGDLGVKVVSVFAENARRGLPTIHALVLAVDAETGIPRALMEGGALTAIRTGAGSGAATDVLARKDARTVAIIGSGVQARTQLEAVCTVREIMEVRIFSADRAQAEVFAAEAAGRGPMPNRVLATEDAATAVRGADIICTATTSMTPVFDGHLLKPGAHVNAIGSFLPTMQEIDAATIQRARVFVDSRAAVLAEAGDFLIPLEKGQITAEHIVAELGEVLLGQAPGRQDDEEITFYKSVGVAVQDAAAAGIILRNAEAGALGQLVTL